MLAHAKNLSDVLLIALRLAGEAEGESYEAKALVATTIYFRSHGKPEQLRAVCLDKRTFPDVENRRLRQLTKQLERGQTPYGPAWQDCMTLARALRLGWFEPALHVDHYINKKARPAWRLKMVHVADVGNHKFYWSGYWGVPGKD